jgi:hypothetical protein
MPSEVASKLASSTNADIVLVTTFHSFGEEVLAIKTKINHSSRIPFNCYR